LQPVFIKYFNHFAFDEGVFLQMFSRMSSHADIPDPHLLLVLAMAFRVFARSRQIRLSPARNTPFIYPPFPPELASLYCKEAINPPRKIEGS
jgi:hypothetical protein